MKNYLFDAEQVKILDDKIKPNKGQYHLDREAAKISALSSGKLEEYEYLTGEDLGYKPDVKDVSQIEILPSDLNKYNPRNKTKIKGRKKLLIMHVNYLLQEKRSLVHLKMIFLGYLDLRMKIRLIKCMIK